MSIVVHKIGGSILADAEALRRAARIALAGDGARANGKAPSGDTPVLVVSALKGSTDALLDVARRAAAGDADGAREASDRLAERHREVAGAFGDAELLAAVDAAFDELSRVAVGLAALRQTSPAITDAVVARGERLAARCLVAAARELGVS